MRMVAIVAMTSIVHITDTSAQQGSHQCNQQDSQHFVYSFGYLVY